MSEDDGLSTPCQTDTKGIEVVEVFLGSDHLKFKNHRK